MLEFLKKIYSREDNSRTKANSRLRLVLTHDRLDMNEKIMETLKGEIIELIASHMEIDGVPDVRLITEGRHAALDISIPLKGRS
ncbi:MAG: cell division topological specificity factor [Syntrophomonadaceae bacterium]|jgi:cell division topological specificity factor|nr:cell division topological specificity factor [Syntrophomonadaceae bacterium]